MSTVNLSSVLSGVGSLVGADTSTTAASLATNIIQQASIGAIAAAGLAALQHPDVKAALLPLDPLNLAGKPASLNPAPAVAPVAATHTITLSDAIKAGYVVNGVANLPVGYTISG